MCKDQPGPRTLAWAAFGSVWASEDVCTPLSPNTCPAETRGSVGGPSAVEPSVPPTPWFPVSLVASLFVTLVSDNKEVSSFVSKDLAVCSASGLESGVPATLSCRRACKDWLVASAHLRVCRGAPRGPPGSGRGSVLYPSSVLGAPSSSRTHLTPFLPGQ